MPLGIRKLPPKRHSFWWCGWRMGNMRNCMQVFFFNKMKETMSPTSIGNEKSRKHITNKIYIVHSLPFSDLSKYTKKHKRRFRHIAKTTFKNTFHFQTHKEKYQFRTYFSNWIQINKFLNTPVRLIHAMGKNYLLDSFSDQHQKWCSPVFKKW